MNAELSNLADFLHSVVPSNDARAREAGSNERNRAAFMAMAEGARRREN